MHGAAPDTGQLPLTRKALLLKVCRGLMKAAGRRHQLPQARDALQAPGERQRHAGFRRLEGAEYLGPGNAAATQLNDRSVEDWLARRCRVQMCGNVDVRCCSAQRQRETLSAGNTLSSGPLTQEMACARSRGALYRPAPSHTWFR